MKLNHVLVKTSNLNVMTQFWTQHIGLELGERPPFPFPGAWLYSDSEALIHIVEDSTITPSNSVLSHVALEAKNYTKLIKTLQKNNMVYTESDVPQSDLRQVFIQGPDGLNVEMLFGLSEISAHTVT